MTAVVALKKAATGLKNKKVAYMGVVQGNFSLLLRDFGPWVGDFLPKAHAFAPPAVEFGAKVQELAAKFSDFYPKVARPAGKVTNLCVLQANIRVPQAG